jgi:hypothetical protein
VGHQLVSGGVASHRALQKWSMNITLGSLLHEHQNQAQPFVPSPNILINVSRNAYAELQRG